MRASRVFLLCFFAFFLSAAGALAAEQAATVTFLTGEVALERPGEASRFIKMGEKLYREDRIETQRGSRLELSLPDGSTIRFDERTRVSLDSLVFEEEEERDFKFKVFLGKMWAKVARKSGVDGGFEVSSKTMVSGVRGTVYRLNVDEDDTVVLKVYWGEVLVSGKAKEEDSAAAPGQAGSPAALSAPAPISGPSAVAGPHAVSMEEWTAIVSSMQQIVVRPDGTPSKPFSFDPIQDRNAWVRWNQQRDRI